MYQCRFLNQQSERIAAQCLPERVLLDEQVVMRVGHVGALTDTEDGHI